MLLRLYKAHERRRSIESLRGPMPVLLESRATAAAIWMGRLDASWLTCHRRMCGPIGSRNLEAEFQRRLSRCRFESRLAADSDASNDSKIADGLFYGRMCKGQSDSRRCHRPVSFATECDGLEVLPCVHRIGNASRLAPGFHGRAGDRLQHQASSEAVSCVSESNYPLNIFK